MSKINDKIKTLNELIKIVNTLKDKTIVTTNGVFDILHTGHVKYLEEAKSLGDILIVGLNSDESVRKLKGEKRPINDQSARLKVIAALESVDFVFIFNKDDPREFIESLKPNIHVKAGDYKEDQIIEKETIEKNGGKLVIAKLEEGHSTTNIIDKICDIHK